MIVYQCAMVVVENDVIFFSRVSMGCLDCSSIYLVPTVVTVCVRSWDLLPI